MVEIKNVVKNSPAYKAGVKSGDFIVRVNGAEIKDRLDYEFYTAERKLTLTLHRGADLIDAAVDKGEGNEYADLGLVFESYLMDGKKRCANKCVFCFVDQMPPGMREPLYFKDDDSRMSFLAGNYITLTNLSGGDADRIINMNISPVNISVHATNPDLRVKMMGNKNAGDSLRIMRRFADAGIWMNAQIVLCSGLNDGAELERTLGDLYKFIPSLKSAAVVPVGLTKHRENLYPLRLLERGECETAIETVDRYAAKALDEYGERVFYCADEIFITAQKDIPDDAYYDDYPQLDNGVGITRLFIDESAAATDVSSGIKMPRASRDITVTLVTGVAAFKYLSGAVDMIKRRWYNDVNANRYNVEFNVSAVRNEFFGESVTVAGLVTAADIIGQIGKGNAGDVLIVPDIMLRSENDVFLDGLTPSDVGEALGVRVETVSSRAGCFRMFLERLADIIGSL